MTDPEDKAGATRREIIAETFRRAASVCRTEAVVAARRGEDPAAASALERAAQGLLALSGGEGTGARLTAEQMELRMAALAGEFPPESVWRHEGTGGHYEVVGIGFWEEDMDPAVTYAPLGGRAVFHRRASIFRARFARVKAEPQPKPAKGGSKKKADQ